MLDFVILLDWIFGVGFWDFWDFLGIGKVFHNWYANSRKWESFQHHDQDSQSSRYNELLLSEQPNEYNSNRTTLHRPFGHSLHWLYVLDLCSFGSIYSRFLSCTQKIAIENLPISKRVKTETSWTSLCNLINLPHERLFGLETETGFLKREERTNKLRS